MKKLICFIGIFLFISCSPSKEELLISDYEQTIGNTKTDLNLKFVNVEFVKNISLEDNLIQYIKSFNEESKKKMSEDELILGYEKLLKEKEEERDEYKFKLKYEREENVQELLKEFIEETKEEINSYNENINFYKEMYDPINLEYLYQKKHINELNKDSVVQKVYSVIFKINNPKLNGVEQTISKTYYFDSDLTKVIKVRID